MKGIDKDREENNMDSLLFAYLEGELTEEEVKQLEERIAHEPVLQAELELWKESYLTQVFYHTQALEASLIQEEVKPVSSSASTFIFTLALIVSVLSFLPLSPEKETRVYSTPVERHEFKPAAAEKAITAQTDITIPNRQSIFPVSQNRYLNKPVAQLHALTEKTAVEKLPVSSFIPVETRSAEQIIAVPEAKMKKLLAKRLFIKQPLTRKERRKIQQMKEKALQQRKASEFLKGRVPYVVPLNTNNF